MNIKKHDIDKKDIIIGVFVACITIVFAIVELKFL
jgi:hypothetical protein